MTTRSQVVEQFGLPRFEGPFHSATTSTTTTTAIVEGKPQTTITTVQVDESPQQTKAIYPYTRLQSTPFYVKVYTSQFWLVYDEHGVVQGYGFMGDVPAGRPSANTVAHRPTS